MNEQVLSKHQDFHCSDKIRIEPKLWGREEWIINTAKYCGKKLVFNPGFCCSLHYHKIKEETFYLLTGKVLLEVGPSEQQITKRIMLPGDVQHIPVGTVHRITGIEYSELMEFSTFHQEDDSYRLVMAGRVDLTAELF